VSGASASFESVPGASASFEKNAARMRLCHKVAASGGMVRGDSTEEKANVFQVCAIKVQ